MELAAAREPPRRTRSEKQVIHAVPVEIAYAVFSEGIGVDDVAGADINLFVRVERDRVIPPIALQARMREDIIGNVCAYSRFSSDFDCIVFPVLPSVSQVPELN